MKFNKGVLGQFNLRCNWASVGSSYIMHCYNRFDIIAQNNRDIFPITFSISSSEMALKIIDTCSKLDAKFERYKKKSEKLKKCKSSDCYYSVHLKGCDFLPCLFISWLFIRQLASLRQSEQEQSSRWLHLKKLWPKVLPVLWFN